MFDGTNIGSLKNGPEYSKIFATQKGSNPGTRGTTGGADNAILGVPTKEQLEAINDVDPLKYSGLVSDVRTKDLGGNSSTKEYVDKIIENL